MGVLLPSGETRNFISVQKERSRLPDRSRLSMARFIILNYELSRISIIVGGNTLKCSPGRTPSGSPSHEHYKAVMVLEGTSMPSVLLSRSYLLSAARRCMPYEPVPSLSFPLPHLGGWLLREVSQLISWRSTYQIGPP